MRISGNERSTALTLRGARQRRTERGSRVGRRVSAHGVKFVDSLPTHGVGLGHRVDEEEEQLRIESVTGGHGVEPRPQAEYPSMRDPLQGAFQR